MSPKKGDIVAETGDNVAVFGDIVAGVDGALVSSKLLLCHVWIVDDRLQRRLR